MLRNFILLLFITNGFEYSFCQTNNYSKALNNCFKIECYKEGKLTKTGSGFILLRNQSNYDCLTNEHVLDNVDSAVLVFSNDKKYNIAGIRATFHVLDICYFFFTSKDYYEGVLTKAWAKQISNANTLLGSNIITVSSPKGLLNTLGTGIVSAFREIEGTHLIQMTAPISPGSSGGLLADYKCNPVGVIVSHISDGQSLNFAVSFKQILEELIKNKLVTSDLVLMNSPVFELNKLDRLIINSDANLKNITENLLTNEKYGQELLIATMNNRLTNGLLFMKTVVFQNKKDWNLALETLIFYKKKYNDFGSDFLLSSLASELIAKPEDIGFLDKEYLTFLKENGDEYWEVYFYFFKGLFFLKRENFNEAVSNLSYVSNFIYTNIVDEVPENSNKQYFSNLFWSKTLNSLSYCQLKIKDFKSAMETSMKGIVFSYALQEDGLLEMFGNRYLGVAFSLGEYDNACSVRRNYLGAVRISEEINYFVKKYCK